MKKLINVPFSKFIENRSRTIIIHKMIIFIVKYSNINDDNINNDIINMLLYINLNLFLIIILKNIKIIIPQKNNYQNLENLLCILQNKKIELIKYNIDGHSFPDYYIQYVIELTDKLYISM